MASPPSVAAAVEGAMALGEEPDEEGRGYLEHPGSWRDAIRRDWRELRVAPPSVKADKAVVLGAVQQDERAFESAAEILRGDRDFVLQVVRVRGEALRHAAPDLRGDREVVLEAIGQDRCALRHASEAVRADVAVAAEAMRRRPVDPHLLCATEELSVSAETAREACHTLDASVWRRKVSRDWRRLVEAPAAVRGDREIVLEAVRDSWGDALRYASAQLRGDKDLVTEAVKIRGCCLQFASDKVRNDADVVWFAVNQDWQALAFAGQVPRASLPVIEEAFMQSTEALEHAAESIRSDRDFMRRCAGSDGLSLRFAAPALCGDPDIALAAFKQNALALRWIPEEARDHVWASTREPELGYRATATRWIDKPPPRPAAADAGEDAAPAIEAGAGADFLAQTAVGDVGGAMPTPGAQRVMA